MSTLLQITQKVARDSGVVSGVQPSTTQSQTGLLGKLVATTQEAWRRIQNAESTWLWMRGEFAGTTIAGSPRYTAATWNITDWAEWIGDPHEVYDHPVSLYKASLGVADEGPILQMPFERWRQRFARGAQQNNRPQWYAFSPAGEFCLGSVPDLGPTPDSYTVKGIYRKTVQELVNDGDVPNCPARFHDVIAYYANMLFEGRDEAPMAFANSKFNKEGLYWALMRDQMPIPVIRGNPIA